MRKINANHWKVWNLQLDGVIVVDHVGVDLHATREIGLNKVRLVHVSAGDDILKVHCLFNAEAVWVQSENLTHCLHTRRTKAGTTLKVAKGFGSIPALLAHVVKGAAFAAGGKVVDEQLRIHDEHARPLQKCFACSFGATALRDKLFDGFPLCYPPSKVYSTLAAKVFLVDLGAVLCASATSALVGDSHSHHCFGDVLRSAICTKVSDTKLAVCF